MQEQRTRPMSDALGLHRVNHAQLVDMFGHMREQLRNVLPTPTVLLEIPEWL